MGQVRGGIWLECILLTELGATRSTPVVSEGKPDWSAAVPGSLSSWKSQEMLSAAAGTRSALPKQIWNFTGPKATSTVLRGIREH